MEKIKIIKIPASKMIKTPEFDPGSESFFQIMQKLWITVVDKHKTYFQGILCRSMMIPEKISGHIQ